MNEEQRDELTDSMPVPEKDQALAHFQEITNLYDMEQCKAILESTNWNLDQAIQSYFSGEATSVYSEDLDVAPPPTPMHSLIHQQHHQHLNFSIDTLINNTNTTRNELTGEANNDNDLNEIYAQGTSIPTNSSNFESFLRFNNFNGTISSGKATRLITFNIEFHKLKFALHMPDNETVLKLKQLIYEEINIPVKYQKLKGWKNKDARISDFMQLSELSLPAENTLFVININAEDDNTQTGLEAETINKIDNFELNIFIILPTKTTGQIIKIINNSKSADSESLAKHLANETFKPTVVEENNKKKNYRLHFEANIKFVEIKKKIATLTNLNANEQEWWLLYESGCADYEAAGDVFTLTKLLESGKCFNLPLTVLAENELKLSELKSLLDNLTESNTKVATSLPLSLPKTTSQTVTSVSNSKLTPPQSAPLSTQETCKISFLVTSKRSNSQNSQDNSISIPGTSYMSYQESGDDVLIEEEEDISHDNENDDEDIDDDSFMVDATSKQNSLIPASCPCGDELLGTNMFVEEFFKRYQPIIPLFQIGTLEDAIKEALLCPAKERKLLGIYLHSDNSVSKHIFCSKTLCDENVVNFLTANFVVWPWDLSVKEHEAHFYSSCSKYLGSVVASHLRNNKIEYPAFLIVNRTRGSNEVIGVIEGNSSSDMMMQRLMQAYEMFEEQRIKDERDEVNRDEREKIKREQDAAYQASLECDKAKRQRQAEENERQKQAAQLEQEEEKQKKMRREDFIKQCMQNLPEEPSDQAPTNKVTKIRYRMPGGGETLQRKFFITDKLKAVVDFAQASGYLSDEYKILSSWPRKDLTNESEELTLEELKLFPQETLTLEQR